MTIGQIKRVDSFPRVRDSQESGTEMAVDSGITARDRCPSLARTAAVLGLLLTILATPSPLAAREKDKISYGEGLIVNIPLPENEVEQEMCIRDRSEPCLKSRSSCGRSSWGTRSKFRRRCRTSPRRPSPGGSGRPQSCLLYTSLAPAGRSIPPRLCSESRLVLNTSWMFPPR